MTSEDLYAKYHRLIWRVARAMQRTYALSEEDVEDIVGFACLRLVSIPVDKRNVPPYVRTAINNSCRDKLSPILRRRSREESSDAKLLQLKDDRPSAESVVLSRELLSQAISRLSPEERYLVHTTWLSPASADTTPQQIAASLNIPAKQLRKQLEAIYAKLRTLIEDQY